jgi:opacity protein-like surface antigen
MPMNSITNIFRRTLFFTCSLVVATDTFGQIKLGAITGVAHNIPRFESDQDTQSPDLYGAATGGYAGLRLQYGFTTRFSIASEMCYQTLPYTNKFVTGQFYPGYLTLSVLPTYATFSKVSIEAGAGTGLTAVSRFEDENDNDPLILGTLGVRFPLGKWGLCARYFHFLRPLHRQTTVRGETTFSSHGIQIGATYDFFKR